MPTLEKVVERVVEPTYEHIWVTPRYDDPKWQSKCGLWEIHPQHPHPNGEVFVDPGETVLVARTPAVDEAISDRRLREVHNYTPPAKSAETDEARRGPGRPRNGE